MSLSPKLLVSLIIVSDTAFVDPTSEKCIPELKQVLLGDCSNTGGGDDHPSPSPWEVNESLVRIVPDDTAAIRAAVHAALHLGANLILTSGGTGFAVKDRTPEVCTYM